MLFTEVTMPQLVAEISETAFWNYERNVAKKLLEALMEKDMEKLDWFAQFGGDLHHLIQNFNTHFHQLKYGFADFSFNEYGWLNKPIWIKRENIEFRVKEDRHHCQNLIDLAQGKNGLWAWGYWYSTGNGGGAGGASEFCEPCKTREEAIKLGVEYLLGQHNKAKENASKYGDSCHNYKKSTVIK